MWQGERLRAQREQRNYSRKALASILEISAKTLARYEADEFDPPGNVVAQMAELLSVSTDYLLGHTSNPMPSKDSGELTLEEWAIIAALRRRDAVSALRAIADRLE